MSKRNVILLLAGLLCFAAWVLIELSGRNAKVTSFATEAAGPQISIQEAPARIDDNIEALDIDPYSMDSVLEDWQSKLSPPAKLEHREIHRINMDVPLVNRYEDLVNKSLSGDPVAATDLAASLWFCASAPRDDEEQDRLINHTNRTRLIEGNIYPVEDLDGAIRKIVRRYEFCKGITREQILNSYLYETIAAENGSLQAKARSLNYGKGMYIEDIWAAIERAWSSDEERQRRTAQYTAEAAAAGNASAIYRLGRIIGTGDSVFGDSNSKAAEAAAYRIAGARMLILSGRYRALYQPQMEKAFNDLSPSDATIALAIANEIMERENCCFVYKLLREYENED